MAWASHYIVEMPAASMRVRAQKRDRHRFRRIASLGAIGLIASVSTTPALVMVDNSAAGATPSVVDVMAWAPYWKAPEALKSFTGQSSQFSELTPFFFVASSQTAIGFNTNMSNPEAALSNYRTAATNSGKPLVATIVDGMGARGMAGVLADPATRADHVQALVEFANVGGYSGVDLDYESFAFNDGRSSWPATHDYWGAFLTDVSAALHAAGKTLAVSVPPIYDSGQTVSSGYWVYNYPVMGQVVDRIRIMTYSYSVGSPGPVGPYDWVSSSIDAALAIVPASKVVMGIAAYGTDWVTNVAGSCPVGIRPSKKSVTTQAAAQYAADRGATPHWGAATALWPAGPKEKTFSYVESFAGPDPANSGVAVRCNVSRTVWYSDPDAIYKRVLLAQSKGIKGVALWALGYDDPATWDGILNARANNNDWQAPAPLPPKAIGAAVVAPYPAPISSSGPLPARYLDTRPLQKTTDGQFAGNGRQEANSVLEVKIAGRGAVPTATPAVTLNVTVLGEGTGYVTVYPCGTRPTTSSLNVKAGQTISNSVITKLSASGTVCIYTQAPANVVIDVFNVLPTTTFSPLPSPTRLLETRQGEVTIDGQFAGGGALTQGSVLEVPIAARGGISDTAKTAVLNVTAVGATGPGFLTVWPCDTPQPATSNVNYVAGAAIPNAVVTGLSATGTVCIFSSNSTHLVIDAFGELDPDMYQALARPVRLMDTRSGYSTVDGTFSATGKFAGGQETALQIGSRGGLSPNPTAVILNVTVDAPELAGFVSVYPCGTARPLVSNVNFSPLQTLANLVVTKLASNGTVCIFTNVKTHVVVDAFGALTL